MTSEREISYSFSGGVVTYELSECIALEKKGITCRFRLIMCNKTLCSVCQLLFSHMKHGLGEGQGGTKLRDFGSIDVS